MSLQEVILIVIFVQRRGRLQGAKRHKQGIAMIPVMKKKCATCPFREGSKYACLAPEIAELSLREGRICHSTGTNDLKGDTGKPDRICRGSRDLQLQVFVGLGFLPEATDAAWNAKAEEMGIA